MAEEYIYAVTRVHAQEAHLLNAQDLEQLIAAKDVPEALRMLTDKGWGAAETPPNDPDALVAAETKKTWDLIGELAGGLAPFDVFRLATDFHNLKAAIKLAYSAHDDSEPERYFLPGGTVEVEKIMAAASGHDFSALPEAMAKAGQEAYEVLAHAGNGQAADMVVDRAALVAISKAGKAAQSELLRRYAEITVDSANIKAAVRCCRMKKPKEFIEKAVAPAGTLDTKGLVDAAATGMSELFAFLEAGPYAGAVDALKTSLAAFERWCDNQLMALIRPQHANFFGIEPLAAFILGRENEIAMVRLILSAKLNHLGADLVRERLRDTYV